MATRTTKKRRSTSTRGTSSGVRGASSPRTASSKKLEGEGSYTATRRYNQNLAQALVKGGIARGAERARKALEGPEGAELRRAERIGKQGPSALKRKTRSRRAV